jgi:hypothetical protein
MPAGPGSGQVLFCFKLNVRACRKEMWSSAAFAIVAATRRPSCCAMWAVECLPARLFSFAISSAVHGVLNRSVTLISFANLRGKSQAEARFLFAHGEVSASLFFRGDGQHFSAAAAL